MSEPTLGAGFLVGHWTDSEAMTGCTVILPPRGNVTSCEIRGSSPSSRELVLLHSDRRLTEVHGVVLTGGSAFGLASATGVVDWLAERGVGYETPVAVVPIVPAAVIFDLGRGRSDVRPGPEHGRAACDAAVQEDVATGRVGAGTGATVGKWAGLEYASPGGFGIGVAREGALTAHAVAVVNSVGDVVASDGSVVAGTLAPDPHYREPPLPAEHPPANTVLVLAAVRARLDKRDTRWLAARAADGITVAVRPAHTRYDGDVAFAVAAPPEVDAEPVNLDLLGHLVTDAVAGAIRNAPEHQTAS